MQIYSTFLLPKIKMHLIENLCVKNYMQSGKLQYLININRIKKKP
jgi:hypothetical protein